MSSVGAVVPGSLEENLDGGFGRPCRESLEDRRIGRQSEVGAGADGDDGRLAMPH